MNIKFEIKFKLFNHRRLAWNLLKRTADLPVTIIQFLSHDKCHKSLTGLETKVHLRQKPALPVSLSSR